MKKGLMIAFGDVSERDRADLAAQLDDRAVRGLMSKQSYEANRGKE